MSNINFERLVSKKQMYGYIKSVLKLNDNVAAVYSINGQVLIGEELISPIECMEIIINNKVVGYIKGYKNCKEIAAIINYTFEKELTNKALGQETLEKYRETAILYDITEKLAARLDSKEVVTLIIKEIKRLIKADHVTVMFYDEDEGILKSDKLSFKLGEGLAGSVAKSGKAEIINNVSEDSRYVSGNYYIYSMICAPLMIKDKLIGVLSASVEKPYNYTANDLKILSTLAFQASIAVENARLFEGLEEAFLAMVCSLSETIDKRDIYTGGHTKRVMTYSMAIGDILGISESDMERVRLGSILHDIGKIGIRDDVLLKESKLTDEEYEKIKMHTVFGHEIISHIKYLNNIIPAIRNHHERYDGRGYPDKIEKENIDIIARIIAVADTYDAMTSDRPYRKGLSHEVAMEELKKNVGMQFDGQIVKAFDDAFIIGKILREVVE